MTNNMGNYGKHAQYWDWGKFDYDRTPNDEYWFDYAKKYGSSALFPMCAWGNRCIYGKTRYDRYRF